MPIGELVFASVVDQRVHAIQGDSGPNAVYLVGAPGLALPFVLYRAWKIGTGTVTENVDFYAPSGRLVYRWGPVVRRMLGQMDLTEERDLVADAVFDETGMYVASFVIDDEGEKALSPEAEELLRRRAAEVGFSTLEWIVQLLELHAEQDDEDEPEDEE